MYPLKSITEFLLNGAGRIPAEHRTEALVTMFTGLLPSMTDEEIAAARSQVLARFATEPQVTGPAVDLIDGHLALRRLLAPSTDDPPPGFSNRRF